METGATNVFIAKCYRCEGWFRSLATDVAYTAEDSEVFTVQRWCLSCLNEVESKTEEILKEFNPFQDDLPFWSNENKSDEPDEGEAKEDGE